MRIAIGSDHAGYKLKDEVIKHLDELGYDIVDFGTNSLDSCDYPDFALPAAQEVANGDADFGILICYTGIGMSMAANKVHGIRAALVAIEEDALLTRQHNNANVLCLSAKNLKTEDALHLVDVFLNEPFSNNERHQRRINKVMDIENN